jgi:hypothetical protein
VDLNARRDDLIAVTEVVAALGRYVRANPQAALVASGEMECAFGPDGQTVYRAARPAGHEGSQAEPPGS